MKTDQRLKQDVEDELRWAADTDASDITISVLGGVVTLGGFVPGFAEKFEAERLARRIAGVVGVANDIEVEVPPADQRSDHEIAQDTASALESQLSLSGQIIVPMVADGWIRLEGEVEWHYQKDRAESAVRCIRSVKGVINAIQVRPKLSPAEIKRQIEDAFRRGAEVDAKSIEVEAHDGEVTLKGTVRSWFEREQAERAAWAAPGVKRVEDRIVVKP